MRLLMNHAIPFVGAVALSAMTGCSLLAAAGNPGAIWALNDPATLQVVVRRADTALITTAEVNRLLTATPAGKDTPWVASVSPDPKEAAAEMKSIQSDPDYAVTKARVVAAEVWMRTLANVGATTGEHPSLLAAIDDGLAASFTAIGIKQAEIASLKAQIETEKQAASADGVSPADKKTHEDQAKTLQKQADDADGEVAPLRKTFLGQVKDACTKLPDEDKARYAPAVGSLLQALADADIANSAAALKYPIVIKQLPDAIKKVVPNIAADVIEEQTGARPSLANLKVSVTISGGSPSVTLDGLGDLGALKPVEVIKVTATRSIAWFTHTLSLLAVIATTKDRIDFERDTLTQMQVAFAPAAPSLVVVKIPAFDSPDVTRAMPTKLRSAAAMKHSKESGEASIPSAPGLPGMPKAPGLPGAPKLPGMPGAPKVPGVAGAAAVPGAPALPGGGVQIKFGGAAKPKTPPAPEKPGAKPGEKK